jgi:glycosyltransferase involved in cell wall biosynthesis
MLARAGELGLDGSLFLLGNRGQRWIASLLAEADVVVAPMMGRALVEAALSATPIVAYDVDWHGELITDGETGVLVPFGDREAMAGAVLRLLANPGRAAELGSRARHAALDTMSTETVGRAEREAWLRVLPQAATADTDTAPTGSRRRLRADDGS